MQSITSKVFIPHDDLIWVCGEIVSEPTKETVEVRIIDKDLPLERGTKIISLPQLRLTNLPLQNVDLPADGVDDMCSLSYLHEPSILDNLRRRFLGKRPYTYTGEICVAVNPYRWFDNYSIQLRAAYEKCFKHELPPHVYSSSAAAYRGVVSRGSNQCILVSGESGAGKTETVKILMGHLAFIASKQGDRIVDKLLRANPLLESFGNAKTIRNDNSSRFGKFTQLEFDVQNQLAGSKCVTYLLEKSRVVSQNANERSYHIMYELLSAPEKVRGKLMLVDYCDPADYNYLCHGDCSTEVIEGVTDSDRYCSTVEALQLLGVNSDTRHLMEKVLAGILHLGQLTFSVTGGSTDGVQMGKSSKGLDDESEKDTLVSLEACCLMLGLEPSTFKTTAICRNIEVEGKKIEVPLTLEQTLSGRDALAKEIYARLFNWLVLVVNFSTSHTANSNNETTKATIALLDIFGFESFAVNRFEQLCINYANEKLQQKFALDVFKTVQKEYEDEGIRWDLAALSDQDQRAYKDNSETLEMIDGRSGSILAILNEECLIPKGNDANLLAKLLKSFSNHPSFSVPRMARQEFNVHHYAGVVSYNIAGFLDRNKDSMPNNMSDILTTSTNLLLRRLFIHGTFFRGESTNVDRLLAGDRQTNTIFLLLSSEDGAVNPPDATNSLSPVSPSSGVSSANQRASTRVSMRTSRMMNISNYSELDGIPSALAPSEPDIQSQSSKRASLRLSRRLSSDGGQPSSAGFLNETVTTKFQYQLATLMEVISLTEVQYVRCIKPNSVKSGSEFNRCLVVEQLRSAGMIEAVRISRSAYPNRLPYLEFYNRYRYLKTVQWHKQTEASILKGNGGKGLSPFDLTVAVCRPLIHFVAAALNKDNGMKFVDDEMFQFGATKIYFSSKMMEKLEAFRTKAIHDRVAKIQSNYRRLVLRRKFIYLRKAAVIAQTRGRTTIAIKRYRVQIGIHRKLLQCSIKIQSVARRFIKRSKFLRIRKVAVLIQSIGRMILRRRRFITFRDQMRHMNDLEAARLSYQQSLADEREKQRVEMQEKEAALKLHEELLRRKAAEAEAELIREREAAKMKEEELKLKLAREQEELIKLKAAESEARLQKEKDMAKRKEEKLRLQLQKEQEEVLRRQADETQALLLREKEVSRQKEQDLRNEMNEEFEETLRRQSEEALAIFEQERLQLLAQEDERRSQLQKMHEEALHHLSVESNAKLLQEKELAALKECELRAAMQKQHDESLAKAAADAEALLQKERESARIELDELRIQMQSERADFLQQQLEQSAAELEREREKFKAELEDLKYQLQQERDEGIRQQLLEAEARAVQERELALKHQEDALRALSEEASIELKRALDDLRSNLLMEKEESLKLRALDSEATLQKALEAERQQAAAALEKEREMARLEKAKVVDDIMAERSMNEKEIRARHEQELRDAVDAAKENFRIILEAEKERYFSELNRKDFELRESLVQHHQRLEGKDAEVREMLERNKEKHDLELKKFKENHDELVAKLSSSYQEKLASFDLEKEKSRLHIIRLGEEHSSSLAALQRELEARHAGDVLKALAAEREKLTTEFKYKEEMSHQNYLSLHKQLDLSELRMMEMKKQFEDERERFNQELAKKESELKDTITRYDSKLAAKDQDARLMVDQERERHTLDAPRRQEEVSFLKVQLLNANRREETMKAALDDEKEKFRLDSIRRDEMTMTLHQSFKKQIETAEQRERDAKLQLDKTLQVVEQMKTDLQKSIEQHQKELSRQTKASKVELEEERQKYAKEKDDLVSKYSKLTKLLEKEKKELILIIEKKDEALQSLSTSHEGLNDQLQTALQPAPWVTTTEIYIILAACLVAVIACWLLYDENIVMSVIKRCYTYMRGSTADKPTVDSTEFEEYIQITK